MAAGGLWKGQQPLELGRARCRGGARIFHASTAHPQALGSGHGAPHRTGGDPQIRARPEPDPVVCCPKNEQQQETELRWAAVNSLARPALSKSCKYTK
jgi:hypothetical protein